MRWPSTSAPSGATEGATVSGVVATFSDGDNSNPASDYGAVINWGDGTTTAGAVTLTGGHYAVSDNGSHKYADKGNYTITVTLTETDAPHPTAAASGTATVADALAVSVNTFSVAEGSVFSGAVATFSDGTNNASNVADYGAVINWGDGRRRTGPSASWVASSW